MDLLSRIRFEFVGYQIDNYKKYEISNNRIKKNEYHLDFIKEFENKDFIDKNFKEIENLCANINEIYAKKLGISPALIEYLTWCDCEFMQTFTDRNYIQISDEFYKEYQNNRIVELNREQIGYFYLYGILHETYHTYQNYNLHRYFNDNSYNENDLKDYLESMIVEFNTRGYSYFEQQTFYRTDLTEFRANLFAFYSMIELVNKGYVDSECVKFLKLQFKKYVKESFHKDNVKFVKKTFKANLEKFKEIKTLDGNDYNVNFVKNLQKLCQECEELDIDKIYQKTLKDIDKLENNINLLSKAEEQLKHTN